MIESLLPGIILLPLALAIMLLLPPMRAVALWLAPWAALPAFVAALVVDLPATLPIPWLLLGSEFGLDRTGELFLLFTSFLWLCAGIYSRGYFPESLPRAHFFVWFLLSMSGNLGLILAQDLVSFFLFFALMSFAAYGLIIHDRSEQALRAGRIYIILVIVGEVLLFTASVMAAMAADDLSFEAVQSALAMAENQNLTIGLALLGFGIKAGLIGLHIWLPLAHPVAPTPASAVLSGAMIKAGLLGWLRLLPLGEVASTQWGNIFIVIGLTGAFYGVLVGLTQRNPKTVLAYSSISQMGVVSLAMGIGFLSPSHWPLILSTILIYILHHGLAKGALFLSVGIAAQPTPHPIQRFLLLCGLLLPALALAGAPFTSGMLAKVMLKEQLYITPLPWRDWLQILLPLSSMATTLIMARFLYLIWPRIEDHPKGRRPRPLFFAWSLLLAAVLCVVWLLPFDRPEELWRTKTFIGSLWPIILAIALAGLWCWRSRRSNLINRIEIPPGDILIVIEKVVKLIPRPRADSRAHHREHVTFSQPLKTPVLFVTLEFFLGQWQIAIGLFALLVIGLFLFVAC